MHLARHDAARAQRREHLREERELALRRGEIRLVRASEVRVDAVERKAFLAGEPLDQVRRLLGRDSHARHAGIDLDLQRDRAIALGRGLSQQREVARVLHHRRHAEFQRGVRLGRVVHAAEHEDRLLDAGSAQLRGFFDRRDRETSAARGCQAQRDRFRAVPVGIGLYDRDHLARAGEPFGLGEVLRESLRVDAGEGGTHGSLLTPLAAGSTAFAVG